MMAYSRGRRRKSGPGVAPNFCLVALSVILLPNVQGTISGQNSPGSRDGGSRGSGGGQCRWDLLEGAGSDPTEASVSCQMRVIDFRSENTSINSVIQQGDARAAKLNLR